MNVTNNTIYNDDMAGPPPILKNQSNVEGSALQARQNPFDLSLTPSPRISATGYTVDVEDLELTKPNLPRRKNFPGHVSEKIIRLSDAKSSVFGSRCRLTQLTKSHALVVQDQKQLDFVNWQIKHGYIDADKLERLDLYFRPQDVQSLPSSLIRFDLN